MYLNRYFESITVIPLTGTNEIKNTPICENVIYCKPIFEEASLISGNSISKTMFLLFVLKHWKVYLAEFLDNRLALCKANNLRKLVETTSFIVALLNNEKLIKILKATDERTVLYFFWGRGLSEIIPFLSGKLKRKKTLCRMHGYDLYVERNNGYIPFQSQQIRYFDTILPCSNKGAEELIRRNHRFKYKIQTLRLGVEYKGRNPSGKDHHLRIVSCSNVIHLKRVHLIYHALQLLEVPVLWVHFGNGELFNKLQQLSKNSKSTVQVILKGQVSNNDILEYYLSNPVDLFLNVSETEGVPVSIMEAMSFGIPIIATDVGGTSEIVTNDIGFLLNKDFKISELAAVIAEYFNLSSSEKHKYREAAHYQFEKKCSSNMFYPDLLNHLMS